MTLIHEFFTRRDQLYIQRTTDTDWWKINFRILKSTLSYKLSSWRFGNVLISKSEIWNKCSTNSVRPQISSNFTKAEPIGCPRPTCRDVGNQGNEIEICGFNETIDVSSGCHFITYSTCGSLGTEMPQWNELAIHVFFDDDCIGCSQGDRDHSSSPTEIPIRGLVDYCNPLCKRGRSLCVNTVQTNHLLPTWIIANTYLYNNEIILEC